MSISDYIKASGNTYASVAEAGITAADVSNFVDSGSYALNALLSGSLFGGFPGNKITLCGAPSSTGKTYFALGGAQSFQEKHKQGIVIIFESESAITKVMLQERGLDTKRTLIFPVATVEDFRTQCLKIVRSFAEKSDKERKEKPLFFILDSMGMLSTKKEVEDMSTGNDKRDMTKAQLLKGAFRVLTLELGRAGIPMFVTNHVYEQVGAYIPTKVQGGGSGSVYAASSILELSKSKDKDKNDEGVSQGAIVTVTAAKSRFTREGTKVKCLIRHAGGLDRYFWLPEMAISAGVFTKPSTKYELPDGTKVFGKELKENGEKYFTQEILEQIDVWVQKRFKYLSGGDEHDDLDTSSEIDAGGEE